jgi:hypothetical protein
VWVTRAAGLRPSSNFSPDSSGDATTAVDVATEGATFPGTDKTLLSIAAQRINREASNGRYCPHDPPPRRLVTSAFSGIPLSAPHWL